MNDNPNASRSALFREAATFQLKLMADGFRDLLLAPISFFAALVGLLRGGDEPDREFRQVLELGRRSERWINLFGNHSTAGDGGEASLDGLLERAEELVREQSRDGSVSESASRSIRRAIRAAQQNAHRARSDPSKGEDPESRRDASGRAGQ